MRKPYCVLFIALLIITQSACQKNTSTRKDEGYIINQTDHMVYIDIYKPYNGPEPDIMTKYMTPIEHLSIAPNSRIFVPYADLQPEINYVYDWYSEDYRYSNWMFRPSENISFQTFGADAYTTIRINTDEQGSTERMTCLSGNGKETVWETVDAYDLQGNSVWNNLNAVAKKHKIVIDHTSSITDPNWEYQSYCTPVGMSSNFTLSDTNRFWLYARMAPVPDLVLTNNIDFIAPMFTKATDTLFYLVCTTDEKTGKKTWQQPIYKIAKTETHYWPK